MYEKLYWKPNRLWKKLVETFYFPNVSVFMRWQFTDTKTIQHMSLFQCVNVIKNNGELLDLIQSDFPYGLV